MHTVVITDRYTLAALRRIGGDLGARPAAVVRALVAHADPMGATFGREAPAAAPSLPPPAAGGRAGDGGGLGQALEALEALGGGRGERWRAVDVIARVSRWAAEGARLREALELHSAEDAAPGPEHVLASPRNLGIWLRRVAGVGGVVAGGRRLRRVGAARTGVALWVVEEVDDPRA